MLATFVIGLREGLEAALIVGIIAAFLRRNGRRLTSLWIGVALAVFCSMTVGAGLGLVERSLPQAAQEAMESVIGAVAVVFVTGMILWMNTHSRGMKKGLETDAAHALGRGGARALAVMAFLAVLKEGFETSVFLLATFSAAQSAALAAIGAVAGVLAACAIGWGIFAGGIRLNLARFFRITGVFLILVAAGLVMTTLRTAHEAGWLTAGQQSTVDLSWLVRPGTVRSALITGVLGIPADPRMIEAIGWFAFLIPMALYLYWPARHRPSPYAAIRLRFLVAGGLAVAAAALTLTLPAPQAAATQHAVLVDAATATRPKGDIRYATGTDGTAVVTIRMTGAAAERVPLPADTSLRPTVPASTTTRTLTRTTPGRSMTLQQLVDLAGGRLPVGLNPQQHPGPFTVRTRVVSTVSVHVQAGVLVDAGSHSTELAVITGSGLGAPRTITPASAASPDWTMAPAGVRAAHAAATAITTARGERMLWAVQLPALLTVGALAVAAAGWRARRRLRTAQAAAAGQTAAKTSGPDAAAAPTAASGPPEPAIPPTEQSADRPTPDPVRSTSYVTR